MSHMLRKWGASEYAGFLACPIGFVLVQYVIFIAKLGRDIDENSDILVVGVNICPRGSNAVRKMDAHMPILHPDWHATFHEVR